VLTVQLYKSILNRDQHQEIIIQTCKDVLYVSKNWVIIKQLCPNINNDIEDILMDRQYKSDNILVEQPQAKP
jgi:LPS O-antigen subunit length determinant protein (WzzB/FepE family)